MGEREEGKEEKRKKATVVLLVFEGKKSYLINKDFSIEQ